MHKYSKYWNKYYQVNKSPSFPSNFAKFCKKNLLKTNSKILEIGCGNGRDAIFFSKHVSHVTCLDRSKNAIKIINKIIREKEIINLKPINDDVKNLNKILKQENYDLIYMRWFLHSIELSKENYILNSISKLTKKNPIIAIEARTSEDNIKNNKNTKNISNLELVSNGNHYRRLLDVNDFCKKINNFGFKIIYKRKSKNFSKLKMSNTNQNPSLIRLIIKK